MPKVKIRKIPNRKDKKPYFLKNGKPYAICPCCGKIVEGVEEENIGGNGTVLVFKCKCREEPLVRKSGGFKYAINGGYHSMSGRWVPCDERGYPEINPKKIIIRGY